MEVENYLNLMKKYIKNKIAEIEESEIQYARIKKTFKIIQGSLSSDYIVLHEQFKEIHKTQFFNGNIKELKNLLEKIDNAIKSNCQHICCVDYIDINEDRMQKIQYCEKCWTTLDY